MRHSKFLAFALAAAALPAAGCAIDAYQDASPEDVTKAGDGKFDSSIEAVIVDFELDGELVTDSSFNLNQKIQDQLLYTIGHLNGDRSVGRLDKVVLSDVQSRVVDGKTVVTYHARLPVAWGRKANIPTAYTLKLPRDVSRAGQEAFTAAYMQRCVDFSAHDVTSGNMWYYYRPHRSGCSIASADVVELEASVSLSNVNTTGKFPEYDKIWEDGRLEAVAVFGKYEDGATDNFDAGISAYNRFVSDLRRELGAFELVTTPATIPSSPGVAMPDVTFEARLADGREVKVVALLVDNVRTAGPTFDARYHALTPTADYIAYNGHAGLGANIRALARKGEWRRGQYTLAFINGCDTYAYIDEALNRAHAAVNPDDPQGTKYFDMMTNAMPSFFHANSRNNIAILRALMNTAQPLTFEKIFASIDSQQVVIVSGEHDNVFVPGGGGDPEPWSGLRGAGTVARNQEQRFETPTLAAGDYVFAITGTSDADLYVRVGEAPTSQLFDCRPFKGGSSEGCEVSLNTPAKVHVMVRGWAASSTFELTGDRR
jgi:hypothetical protein